MHYNVQTNINNKRINQSVPLSFGPSRSCVTNTTLGSRPHFKKNSQSASGQHTVKRTKDAKSNSKVETKLSKTKK